MSSKTIKVRTDNGARTYSDTFNNVKVYWAFVSAESLAQNPEIPSNPNPRTQRKTVDSDLADDLIFMDLDTFHLGANGIYIFASDVKIDKDILEFSVDTDKKAKEGIANGGHLYKAIREIYDNGELQEGKKVPVFIYEGISMTSSNSQMNKLDKQTAHEQIVFALNNNKQVHVDSHTNYRGDFNFIKDALKGSAYPEKVVTYSENDDNPQPVLGLIQLMRCFIPNKDDYEKGDDQFAPYMAYGNAQIIRKDFANNTGNYKLIAKSLKDILILRDTIQKEAGEIAKTMFPKRFDAHNKVKPLAFSYNRLRKEDSNPFRTLAVGEIPTVIINNACLYPIIAGFRNFVDDNGVLDLDASLQCWNESKEKFVKKLVNDMEQHEEVRKYAKAGTFNQFFDMVYDWATGKKYNYLKRVA